MDILFLGPFPIVIPFTPEKLKRRVRCKIIWVSPGIFVLTVASIMGKVGSKRASKWYSSPDKPYDGMIAC